MYEFLNWLNENVLLKLLGIFSMQDKRMQKIASNGYENEHGKTESLGSFFV